MFREEQAAGPAKARQGPHGWAHSKGVFCRWVDQALSHCNRTAFPTTVGHLQTLSFGLTAAKAPEQKQAQELHKHTTQKSNQGERNV